MSTIYDPTLIKHEVAKERAYFALTGGIVNDPFWNALTIRRDLNPARFDHYHPNVAAFFIQPPVIMPPVVPPTTVPPPAICPPLPPPPSTNCPGFPSQSGRGNDRCPGFPQPSGKGWIKVMGNGTVPEPSSAILLSFPLVFAGIVLWMRRHHDNT